MRKLWKYTSLLKLNIDDAKARTYLMNNIGTIYRSLGDPSKALDSYKQALKISDSIQNKEAKSLVLKNIGILYFLNLHQLALAEKYLSYSLQLSEELEDHFEQSNCHNYLGELYLVLNDHRRAEGSFRTALKIAEEISSVETQRVANYGLGRIFEREGNLKIAHSYYDRSISGIESIRSGLRAEKFKTSFLIDKTDAYEAAIRTLYEMESKTGEENYGKMAYRYGERSKARAILDRLKEVDLRIERGINNEIENNGAKR